MTEEDNKLTEGEGEGESNDSNDSDNSEGDESTNAEQKAMFKSVTEEMKTLSEKYDAVSKENVGLKEDMKAISENLAKITEALANPIHKSPGIHPKDADEKEDNFYLTYYHDLAVIVPDISKPGVHFLNHSCYPNAFIYIYRGHTLVFALRNILEGEEITISYLLAPKEKWCNPCLHICKCMSKNCTGTMHLSIYEYKL